MAGKVILLRGNGSEPDSFDPQKARGSDAHNILRDIYECLTSLDKSGAPAPGVAHSWTVSDDGLTYTFKLRPEARWSNGDPVVAQDFVVALRRLVDPATASQYAQIVDGIANARDIITRKKLPEALGVTAPDDNTVIIQLEAPVPFLPGLLAHPSTCPVHRPSLIEHGNLFSRPRNSVSNGAFILKEWVPGSHVLVVRNKHYWNNAATRIDGVKYLHITDENAELTRYRAGDLHITATIPRGQLDWIRSNLASELHLSPQLSTYYYGFNLDREPFRSQPQLRQALSMAIDRERLTQAILRAGELPAYSWIPPGIHGYTPQTFDYHSLPYTERVKKARQLYAEAGYSRKNPLRFELHYNTGDMHGKVAVAIASMWKEALGVEVRLVAKEFKSLLEDINQRRVDVFRASWIGDYNDPYTFAQYLKSDFGINLPHYNNPEYDALLEQAAAELDANKRRELLQEAERLMLRDHPLMPIYFYVNKHLVKPQVQGWYDNVMNVVYSKDLALAPER